MADEAILLRGTCDAKMGVRAANHTHAVGVCTHLALDTEPLPENIAEVSGRVRSR